MPKSVLYSHDFVICVVVYLAFIGKLFSSIEHNAFLQYPPHEFCCVCSIFAPNKRPTIGWQPITPTWTIQKWHFWIRECSKQIQCNDFCLHIFIKWKAYQTKRMKNNAPSNTRKDEAWKMRGKGDRSVINSLKSDYIPVTALESNFC